MRGPKSEQVDLKGTISSESSAKGRLSVATCYSLQHIQSAALFSRLSANVETQVGNLSDALKSEYQAYVTGAIFTAVSFLESTINELFWEVLENPTGFETLKSETIDVMARMWKQIVHGSSTLGKYQSALTLAGKPLFDEGTLPYQDVFLLTRVRNALTHYRPEWVEGRPQKLEESLKGRFLLSPFYDKGSPFFPHRCLGHGCAQWAVISSIGFTDDFFAGMSLKPRYDRLRSKLRTE